MSESVRRAIPALAAALLLPTTATAQPGPDWAPADDDTWWFAPEPGTTV